MARIKRRRRVRCKLQCEIALSSKRAIPARIVTISEGGFAVVTTLALGQGESINVVIKPDGGGAPIKLTGIVWNEEETTGVGASSRLHRLGCVVSDPPASYLAILDRLAPPAPRIEAIPVAIPVRREAPAPEVEPDLPRSRELQPPPKREPEEMLPYFRIRMKQIGGPRTRILTLRARSASHAEQLALDELARICSDSAGWGVLHVSRISGSGS